MSHYASIGAVRIQTWIAQSASKLALVRGASVLLSSKTANSVVSEWLSALHPKVTVAADAGDVDGVVVLVSNDKAALRAATEALLAKLDSDIPGLQWEAWIAEGESYLQAYESHGDKAADCRSLPPLTELGLARTCDFCGVEPATGPLKEWEKDGQAGPSCLARKAARDKEEARARNTHDELWNEIPGSWPKEFESLAVFGGTHQGATEQEAVGRTDSRSHLATVAADGNGIGALFRMIAQAKLPRLRADAVRLLNEATRSAVTEAAKACGTDVSTMAVIPHYVGGDDVFVSVAAPSAWRFVVTLGEQFEELRTQLASRVTDDIEGAEGLTEAIGSLGLGIGVAFARRAVPISGTSEAAHAALAAAKASTRGGASAIGWVDLTFAADEIHTVEVSSASGELSKVVANDVFKLGPSARGSLTDLVRSAPADLSDAVAKWAKRTGNTVSAAAVPHLPATLSRARWWPDLPDEDIDEETKEAS